MTAITDILAHEREHRNPVSEIWAANGGTDLETQVLHPPDNNPKAHARIDHEYTEFDLRGPIHRIGSTGRNWVNQRSTYIFGDIDANDHGSKGNSDEDIQACIDACPDYMTLFTSKGGKGLGFKVEFTDPQPFAPTRYAHGVIGDRLRVKLRQDGFPAEAIDTCGENGWFVAADAKPGGFKIIKRATRKLTVDDLPPPEPPKQITTGGVSLDQRPATLTPGIQALMEYLDSIGCVAVWQPEHGCLHTHTWGLQQAHAHFNLPGIFKTASAGTRISEANCFYFPDEGKAIAGRAVRFGKKTPEDPSWNQDGEWTHCELGKRPDLSTAMRSHNAIETEDGEFVLPLGKAADAIELVTGTRPQFGVDIADEAATVAITDDGLTIDIAADGRRNPPAHFRKLTRSKFRQYVAGDVQHDRFQAEALSDLIHCAKQRGEQVGWFLNIDGLEKKPKDDCRSALLSHNPCKPVVAAAINNAAANSKELVKIPFKPELYRDQLNWQAPQLAVTASPGDCPTWLMIFDHLGKYLDQYLKTGWASRNGITTGRDLWIAWIATAIREPESRTTMLSLVGPQESGKSFIEQLLRLLTPNGVIRVDGLLRSAEKFDAELEGMPFCICDEPNIADEAIFNRIKPWITDPLVWVRAMYRQRYPITNYSHWLQFTNQLSYVPVFDDTTRITVIRVDHIPREKQIKTKELLQRLTDEAPAFVDLLFKLTLPTENGRASIPAIETEAKAEARGLTDNPVNSFVAECTSTTDITQGVRLSVFTEAFNEWNTSNDTQKSVKQALQNKGIKVKKRDGYDTVLGMTLKA